MHRKCISVGRIKCNLQNPQDMSSDFAACWTPPAMQIYSISILKYACYIIRQRDICSVVFCSPFVVQFIHLSHMSVVLTASVWNWRQSQCRPPSFTLLWYYNFGILVVRITHILFPKLDSMSLRHIVNLIWDYIANAQSQFFLFYYITLCENCYWSVYMKKTKIIGNLSQSSDMWRFVDSIGTFSTIKSSVYIF